MSDTAKFHLNSIFIRKLIRETVRGEVASVQRGLLICLYKNLDELEKTVITFPEDVPFN